MLLVLDVRVGGANELGVESSAFVTAHSDGEEVHYVVWSWVLDH